MSRMVEEGQMNGEIVAMNDLNGNTYQSYLSVPAQGRGPGVVIGVDIHGMRPLFFEIADLFAEQGYLAAVPDCFWDAKRGDDGSYRTTMKFSTLLDVTRSTMAHLRAHPACNGKVAVTGFCAGGNTAFLGVARFGADAAASYYGTRLHTFLDEIGNITAPTVLHIAEHDHTYPDEERDNILKAARKNPHVKAYVYDAPHGFASSTIDKEAQSLAHRRTFDLFATLK
jgi:carboxymethylenebutenolidase